MPIKYPDKPGKGASLGRIKSVRLFLLSLLVEVHVLCAKSLMLLRPQPHPTCLTEHLCQVSAALTLTSPSCPTQGLFFPEAAPSGISSSFRQKAALAEFCSAVSQKRQAAAFPVWQSNSHTGGNHALDLPSPKLMVWSSSLQAEAAWFKGERQLST